jgi:DNA-binding transcriptional MerR regulator
MKTFKVGELAQRTGLTIRTLHHYDEIGLLKPSGHTESGHRLYTEGDVARLQQILSLRQLGFALDEIRGCLDQPDFSPLQLVRTHLARLHQQIELQQQLIARLQTLARLFERAEEVSADEFLRTMEVMTMVENLYTPEQQQQFQQVRSQVSEEEIRAIEEAWTALLAEIRANLQLDPASAEAQQLADRWNELSERTMRGYAQFPQLKEAIQQNYKQGKFEGFAGAPQSAEFAFMEQVNALRKK